MLPFGKLFQEVVMAEGTSEFKPLAIGKSVVNLNQVLAVTSAKEHCDKCGLDAVVIEVHFRDSPKVKILAPEGKTAADFFADI
jgi:hypothetical protein